MIDPSKFLKNLKKSGVNYFTGVPDSLLQDFCSCLEDQSTCCDHVLAANEGSAIALAIGHHLGTGDVPLVYMQNSGLGNAINPLLSLANEQIYSIPILLLIGWRGQPGLQDEPQHIMQGAITMQMLNMLGIDQHVLSTETTVDEIRDLVHRTKKTSKPHAILVRRNTFSKYPIRNLPETNELICRERCIDLILDASPTQTLFVCTTGKSSRELFELRQKRGDSHRFDFLTVGGMGHASQIAVALANAQPEKTVVCIDGDAAFLMHMGSIAVGASLGTGNFFHFVLNNGCHESVGGQETLGKKISLSKITKSCGYRHSNMIQTNSERRMLEEISDFFSKRGPAFLDIHIGKGSRTNLGRPTIKPVQNKSDFMKILSKR